MTGDTGHRLVLSPAATALFAEVLLLSKGSLLAKRSGIRELAPGLVTAYGKESTQSPIAAGS